MVRQGLGLLSAVIGAGSVDSGNLLIPLALMVIAMILLFGGRDKM